MTAVVPETPPQKPVNLDAYVRALVDAAPPLTADQRARLAVLLSRRKPVGKGNRPAVSEPPTALPAAA